VAAVVALTSGSSAPAGKLSSSLLPPVPTNHVSGSGNVTVRLNGNEATVTLTTQGLDNGAALVHAVHIHGGAKGQCPPAAAARPHNGHLSISTTDGINYYGPPVQSLTTSGDTSPASILAFRRYPTGGTLSYRRTVTLPQTVAAYIRQDNAVIVVHGIDYDGSGIYSGVLDRSELATGLPGTATAPALCGRLTSQQKLATLDRRSRRAGLLYTASLPVNAAAQRGPVHGLFVCHAPEAPVMDQTRRRAGRAAAPSHTT
jgi:hypothetical protein